MKIRTDRHGHALCHFCGVAPHNHADGLCRDDDLITEAVRKIIAQAMAQRSGAEIASSRILELLKGNGVY
jgi:hypothetical protein